VLPRDFRVVIVHGHCTGSAIHAVVIASALNVDQLRQHMQLQASAVKEARYDQYWHALLAQLQFWLLL